MEESKNVINNKLMIAFFAVMVMLFSLIAFNLRIVNASNKEKAPANSNNSECKGCKGYDADTLFNLNTSFVREAALGYYTNERLPKKVDETVKMTLGEMVENKLVHKIVDSNGNSCSLSDSYVEVTKRESEYVFKIYLSCSDVKDYILVFKGCTDYCGSNSCNEVKPEEPKDDSGDKTYEYEYKKTNYCKFTNWSEWSNWKTEREEIKNSNYKREETKTEEKVEIKTLVKDSTTNVSYNCDQYEGYELIGTACVKINSSLLEKDAEKNPTTFNCNKYEGYVLEGTKCIKKNTTTDEKPADENEPTYNCDKYEGYTLVGTKCVKKSSITDEKPADENEPTYNCDKYPGYTLEGKKCVKRSSSTDEKPADKNPTTYNCKKYDGYTLEGNKCVKKSSTTDKKPADKNPTTYNCNKYPGYTLDGNKCKKSNSSVDEKPANPVYKTRSVSYNCGTEYYECGRWVTTTKIETQCDANFNCKDVPVTSSEYVSKTCSRDKTCTKDESYLDGYNCDGYPGYTLSNNVCRKNITTVDEKPADEDEPTYNCNKYDGYTLNGNECIKNGTVTDEKPADEDEPTYNCDNYPGYTLSGSKCVKNSTKTDEKPADENEPTYNCDNYPGYTLSGKKCVKNSTKTDEKPADENEPTYNCDKYEGYTLSGKVCKKKITTVDEKPADKDEPTYNCDKYEGYTLVGNKCVKPVCDMCTKEAEKVEEKVCEDGYVLEGNVCKKQVEEKVNVTYYRYSTRSCVGGSTEIKWSLDQNDSILKAQGFKYTGNRRVYAYSK